MSFLQYKLSTIDKFRIYKIPFRKKHIAAQQANRCSKFRSSHQKCPLRKGVPRNFTKFTGKHLCQSLSPATLLKKRLWHRCFPVNFVKFLGTPFSQNTSGRLLLKIEYTDSRTISQQQISDQSQTLTH